jgi:carboxyl-terminal processing protease
MNSLTQFALVDGIDLKVLSNREKQFLKDRVKTLMARQLWRSEGFYEINNVNDPMVKKALSLIVP